MSADPPTMGPWLIAGYETTWPSSTTARSSCGEELLPNWSYMFVVRVPNALEPAPSKVRLTCQNVLEVCGLALAAWISLPSTWAGARANLYHTPLVPLDRPQATMYDLGLSQTSGP